MMNLYMPPPVLEAPLMIEVERSTSLKAKDIIFKLITTGNKYYKDEIIAIAAFSVEHERGFLKYVMRKKPVEEALEDKAGRLLGPQIKMQNGRFRMFMDGQLVNAVTLAEAMKSFVSFLKVEAGEGKLNLTGDNSTHRDVYFLNEALLETCLLKEYESIVAFYTDTLYLFKESWPLLAQDKRGQRYLIENILEQKYKEYNLAEDVQALGKLVERARGSYLYVKAGTYTYAAIKAHIDYTKLNHELEDTLEPLFKTIRPVIISQKMAKKMTKTGISFDHLKMAYCHSRQEALRKLLAQKIDDKPRVTIDENTVNKLCEFFKSSL